MLFSCLALFALTGHSQSIFNEGLRFFLTQEHFILQRRVLFQVFADGNASFVNARGEVSGEAE